MVKTYQCAKEIKVEMIAKRETDSSFSNDLWVKGTWGIPH